MTETFPDLKELKGLPVPGYKPTQSQEAIDAVALNKELEELVLRRCDELRRLGPSGQIDGRWLAIGVTDIEKGFYALNRAIFQAGRIEGDLEKAFNYFLDDAARRKG